MRTWWVCVGALAVAGLIALALLGGSPAPASAPAGPGAAVGSDPTPAWRLPLPAVPSGEEPGLGGFYGKGAP